MALHNPVPAANPDNLDEVFDELKRGFGHEHVNDRNVDALIERAQQAGSKVLEQELREWKAKC
jgi:hypothetical protein